ncbi:MAG: helicase, partial [Anaerolineae bacterium]|nr:helicase [Anaerolineae bacterium]
IPELANVVLDMKILSETADADFAQAIGSLVTAYEQWIDTQAGRVTHLTDDLKPYHQPAQDAVEKARKSLERIKSGLDLLGSDPQAAEAFRFANRAMWQQRIHTLYAQQQRQGQSVTLNQVDSPQNRRWYPFQLAFILLNLPSVTDIHHQDRSDPTQAIADLLWFPTGGGKTEAYLGLTAYTLGLRRLQGVVDGYSGHAGVAVLMRYTLRLLTLQQFQRATALICACESIRRKAQARGDARWGAEPFRIGLWVGARSTPNRTDDSAEAIKRDRGQYQGGFGGGGTPYQLTSCPWCGSDIGQGRDLVVETYNRGRARTLMYCGDPLGRCLFSRKQSPDEGLPAVVVDEEIYRRLPALLIATVDKFAQMPWKGETQMLFGRVNGYCERHGYRSPEIEDADFHRAISRKFLKAVTKPMGPLRPPDLIIQDELHLISGPLGTLVGLYESAIDYLCSWEANGQRVRPKVIASTATIRRADSQVNHLYLRQVNVFPPAGLDIEDNFFSRQRPPREETPGRRYVGICAPGTRLKTVLIRVYVAYMAAAQQLYEKYGSQLVDPYLTTVGYFNSIRELGGMRRAVDDAVRTRLRKADERGLAKRFIEHYNVEELTSRKGASDIPLILDQLEIPFPPQA